MLVEQEQRNQQLISAQAANLRLEKQDLVQTRCRAIIDDSPVNRGRFSISCGIRLHNEDASAKS